jgi:HEAT repeat protein
MGENQEYGEQDMSDVIDRIGDLLAKLQSSDFYERQEAVSELGTYNQDEAVAGLVLAIEDPDLGIRELAANMLAKIRGNTAAQLLIRFLGHEDIGTRNLAAEILVKIGDDAVQPLIDDINNEDYDVRKFICDIIGLLRSEQAVDALCQKLWDDNINVVCSAAEALGEIGSPKAVPALIACFEKIEDARLQCVEALGKIADPATLSRIIEFLKTDDPMIIFATVDAIGAIGDPLAIPALRVYLDDPDSSIAESALMAIIAISEKNGGAIVADIPMDRFNDFLFDGMRRKNRLITDFTLKRLGHWYGSSMIRGLVDLLDYVEDEDQAKIVEVLGSNGPAASQLIVDKLETTQPITRNKLLEILKSFADAEIAPRLIKFASDVDPEARQKVAHILGISGYAGAVSTLKALAADPVGHVRSAAFAALGWLCDEREVDFLVTGLDDKFRDVREAAVGALVMLGSPRVVAKLNADLYHESTERQRLAVYGLGLIGDQEVIEPLTRAIGHSEPSIRKSAIDSLVRIKEFTDVEPLMLALNDESAAVRKSAVSALLSLKGAEGVHDIRFLLNDEDMWVRYHTICAIGDLRMERFAEFVMPFLQDSQDVIKIAATKALAQMGCRKAIPALAEFRGEKNKDLAEAATLAVTSLQGTR